MVINQANLFVVKGNQLTDATIMVSLIILLTSTRGSQIPRISGQEVRVVASNSMDIKAMIVAIVRVVGRLMARTMLWMPIISRGIQLISLIGINQAHLVIMSICLMRLG